MNNDNNNFKTFKTDDELIDNVYQFIQQTKDEQLQVKSSQFNPEQQKQSIFKQQQDLQLYKKNLSNKIESQIKIISQNIIDTIFNLNDQKYSAILNRINVWGFQLTIERVIMDYYLVVKKDNILRQFVINHLDKIIKMVRSLIQKQAIINIDKFKFVNTDNKIRKQKLQDKFKQNQIKFKELKPKEVQIKKDQEKEDTDQKPEETSPNSVEQQILQKLKKEHPKLEQEYK